MTWTGKSYIILTSTVSKKKFQATATARRSSTMHQPTRILSLLYSHTNHALVHTSSRPSFRVHRCKPSSPFMLLPTPTNPLSPTRSEPPQPTRKKKKQKHNHVRSPVQLVLGGVEQRPDEFPPPPPLGAPPFLACSRVVPRCIAAKTPATNPLGSNRDMIPSKRESARSDAISASFRMLS